jgi:membrane protease YdiL (CAAX protease family)
MDWLNQSRLFDLARQGKRLPHILLVIPLSLLIPFLAGFGAIPVYILMIALYGLSETVMTLEGMPPILSGFWMALQLVASFSLIYVFVGLWLRFFEKRPFWTLGYEIRDALKQYGRGFLIGAVMFSGAVGILGAFGALSFEQGDPANQGLAALGGVLIVLIGWVVQGGGEEVVMRGWVLPVLGARYRPWVGLLVSSLLFAGLHALNPGLSALALFNLTLFGVFAGLYALREGSLWGISALHTVWNWVQGNFFGLDVSGMGVGGGTLLNLTASGPDWLTGGAFGPEGGVAVTVVLLVGIVIFILLPSRPKVETTL